MNNLYKVTTLWLGSDSNQQAFDCMANTLPLLHGISDVIVWLIKAVWVCVCVHVCVFCSCLYTHVFVFTFSGREISKLIDIFHSIYYIILYVLVLMYSFIYFKNCVLFCMLNILCRVPGTDVDVLLKFDVSKVRFILVSCCECALESTKE